MIVDSYVQFSAIFQKVANTILVNLCVIMAVHNCVFFLMSLVASNCWFGKLHSSWPISPDIVTGLAASVLPGDV
jgi:hypothetical protein